jgi:hypothetical protein
MLAMLAPSLLDAPRRAHLATRVRFQEQMGKPFQAAPDRAVCSMVGRKL